MQYSPYGSIIESTGFLPTDRLFTGQRREESIQLYDYRARFYDPLTANFLSPDSIIPNPFSPVGWNRFSYVQNNPIRYTDPSGHCGPCIPIIIGIAIGGFIAYDYLAHPDIAKAPGPFDVIIDNPPIPTDLPGNDEALCLFCRDLQEGNLGAAGIGMMIEAMPLDEIPGVRRLTKTLSKNAIDYLSGFIQTATAIQKNRGRIGFDPVERELWAKMMQRGDIDYNDVFTFHHPETDDVWGILILSSKQHADALEVFRLEGLGSGTDAGTKLLKQAVIESMNRGYGGKIKLAPTSDAFDWYLERGGVYKDGYLYWDEEAAKNLLNR